MPHKTEMIAVRTKNPHYNSYKFHSCLGNKNGGHRLNFPLYKRHSNAPQSQSVAPQSAARKLRPYMSQEELLKAVPTPFLTAELQAAIQAKGVDGLLQMMYDSGQMVKPQSTLARGIGRRGIVIVPGPGRQAPRIGIDPVTDLPYPSPPDWISPIIRIITACIVNAVSTADSLTAAHKAANGDRTKPGYGGKCTPDEHDKRKNNVSESCKSGQKICTAKDTSEIWRSKEAAWQQCFEARNDIMNSCFMGGDKAHKAELESVREKLNTCKGMY